MKGLGFSFKALTQLHSQVLSSAWTDLIAVLEQVPGDLGEEPFDLVEPLSLGLPAAALHRVSLSKGVTRS